MNVEQIDQNIINRLKNKLFPLNLTYCFVNMLLLALEMIVFIGSYFENNCFKSDILLTLIFSSKLIFIIGIIHTDYNNINNDQINNNTINKVIRNLIIINGLLSYSLDIIYIYTYIHINMKVLFIINTNR